MAVHGVLQWYIYVLYICIYKQEPTAAYIAVSTCDSLKSFWLYYLPDCIYNIDAHRLHTCTHAHTWTARLGSVITDQR